MSTFKPGEWVDIPSLNTEPVQYRSDLCHLGLELWKPKPGEWCWFWNDNNYLPNIRQFSTCLKTIDGTIIHLIKQDKSAGILMSHCGIEGYTHCEPFIGQLPTTIKDNI